MVPKNNRSKQTIYPGFSTRQEKPSPNAVCRSNWGSGCNSLNSGLRVGLGSFWVKWRSAIGLKVGNTFWTTRQRTRPGVHAPA